MEKQETRLEMGMKPKPAFISEPIDVRTSNDKPNTTLHLRMQRTFIDNHDIRSKMANGQVKAKEVQKKKDAGERVRVPETDKFDGDNVTAEGSAKTSK